MWPDWSIALSRPHRHCQDGGPTAYPALQRITLAVALHAMQVSAVNPRSVVIWPPWPGLLRRAASCRMVYEQCLLDLDSENASVDCRGIFPGLWAPVKACLRPPRSRTMSLIETIYLAYHSPPIGHMAERIGPNQQSGGQKTTTAPGFVILAAFSSPC